jgi:glycogen debranching enzyme
MATPSVSGGAPLTLPILGDVERLVRARGTTFLVTDHKGDIAPSGARELGLFHKDTRHLSHYELGIHGGATTRLSASASQDAYNQVDLMLSDVEESEFLDDPKNFLHIRRRQSVDGGLVEQVVFTNFLTKVFAVQVQITFGADFADIFEVRGARRPRRGRFRAPRVDAQRVVLRYEGVCGTLYTTSLFFPVAPSELTATRATYELVIRPGASVNVEIRISPACEDAHRGVTEVEFARRAAALEREASAFRDRVSRWGCDDATLGAVLAQSVTDLHALQVTVGPHSIVGAGIPWFCAPFGRDALITAYEALTLSPSLAVDALRTLAAYQGTKVDPLTEEEPGKILHELRFGEMAHTGEIPHVPYYGSIDATPLFVVLAEATYRFTADVAFLQELKPALLAALAWLDARSQCGTSLVTYSRRTEQGLENQGWKDSRAGVSFPDGRRAEPPIALCEVQGYVIDAYARASKLFARLGDAAAAVTYERRARSMREVFEARFWVPELKRYAFAIDGHGRELPTVVSNLGHLLWSRVTPRSRARALSRLLLLPRSFSGYGVRTVASKQAVYNPLSYHNGTVWPHDNALLAKGFANYGLGDAALTIFDGLYAAMCELSDHRLPELFCGIRRGGGPLVRYPVAGSPQAWAAAAPFLLLQSILGIEANAPDRKLVIHNPRLPKYLRLVELRSMRVGDALVDIRFRRLNGRCHVDQLVVKGGRLKTNVELL